MLCCLLLQRRLYIRYIIIIIFEHEEAAKWRYVLGKQKYAVWYEIWKRDIEFIYIYIFCIDERHTKQWWQFALNKIDGRLELIANNFFLCVWSSLCFFLHSNYMNYWICFALEMYFCAMMMSFAADKDLFHSRLILLEHLSFWQFLNLSSMMIRMFVKFYFSSPKYTIHFD